MGSSYQQVKMLTATIIETHLPVSQLRADMLSWLPLSMNEGASYGLVDSIRGDEPGTPTVWALVWALLKPASVNQLLISPNE